MKVVHRAKALECYNGAREVLKMGYVYPSYVLLKESARAVLAYIAEDNMGKDFSDKTKLHNLVELIPDTLVSVEDMDVLRGLIEVERSTLKDIMDYDLAYFREVKSVLKKLIGEYLHEHV